MREQSSSSGFGVLGFRVQGFRVQGLGLRAEGLGFRVNARTGTEFGKGGVKAT